MQWNAGLNAGFSQGTPWLPVESACQTYNAEHEKADPNSVYSWYAQLMKLRRENAALRDGDYVSLDSGNKKCLPLGAKPVLKSGCSSF